MGCGGSKTSALAIELLDAAGGDHLPTRLKASRKLEKQVGGLTAVTVTISDPASGKELLKIYHGLAGASANSGIALSCTVDGETVLSFAKGKLVSGDKALYTSKPKGLFDMGGALVRLLNFQPVDRISGALLPGDVTCAMYTDKGRTESVVYNQLFASKDEAAQAVSRSSVVARAAIMEHVYDRAKLMPVNGKVVLAAHERPFQLKGIAVDTEIRVPQKALEAADGGVDPSLAAFLFFAVLPLLATNRDAFYAPGDAYA